MKMVNYTSLSYPILRYQKVQTQKIIKIVGVNDIPSVFFCLILYGLSLKTFMLNPMEMDFHDER